MCLRTIMQSPFAFFLFFFQPSTPTFQDNNHLIFDVLVNKGMVQILKRCKQGKVNSSFVMTLTLSSWPRKKHGKVWTESATWESHLHSQECEGMNPHTPKWTPTLGIGFHVESWIFKTIFQGSKLIGLKISLYHWKILET